MPQIEISQVVNRETPQRHEDAQAPARDFMEIVRDNVRTGDAEAVRQGGADTRRADDRAVHEQERNPDAASSGESREGDAGSTERADAERAAGVRDDEKAPVKKQPREDRTGDPAEGTIKAVFDEGRSPNVKGREERTGRRETREGTVNVEKTALAGETLLRDQVRAVARAIKGIEESAPGIRSLEKTLNDFQVLQASGGERSRRHEVMTELRTRLKEILQNIESRNDAGHGERGARMAALKGQVKTLGEIVEQQLRGGNKQQNRQEQGMTARMEQQTPQTPAANLGFTVLRETRTGNERTAEGADRIEGPAGTAGRGLQAQMKGAAQAVQRMPLGNEQFESMMNNARMVVRDGRNGSFTMNLYPETLGRVNVNLGLEDGVIVGRFLVDSREARDAMMENIDSLRIQLEEAGIQVGGFQVNVRGERERLVRDLQEAMARPAGRNSREVQRDYEIQTYRSHDGALDVIA